MVVVGTNTGVVVVVDIVMVVVGTYTGVVVVVVVDVDVAGVPHVWLATVFFTPLRLLKLAA